MKKHFYDTIQLGDLDARYHPQDIRDRAGAGALNIGLRDHENGGRCFGQRLRFLGNGRDFHLEKFLQAQVDQSPGLVSG